jgi:hypothetical protein
VAGGNYNYGEKKNRNREKENKNGEEKPRNEKEEKIEEFIDFFYFFSAVLVGDEYFGARY